MSATPSPVLPSSPIQLIHQQPILVVVDDDDPLRKATARTFAKHYTQVVQCSGGYEAVGWLEVWALACEKGGEGYRVRHPVVVLSDVDMGPVQGSGFEVAAWCRAHDVPCILWSGNGGVDSAHTKTAVAMGLDSGVALKGAFMEIKAALAQADEAAGIAR